MARIGMLVLLTVIAVALPRPAQACSATCTTNTHYQRLQYSDVALRARVIEVESLSPFEARALVRPVRHYEGSDGPSDRWVKFPTGHACPPAFMDVGATYDIFATLRDGVLTTGMCGLVEVRGTDERLPDSDRPGRGCGHCGAASDRTGVAASLVLVTLAMAAATRRRRRKTIRYNRR